MLNEIPGIQMYLGGGLLTVGFVLFMYNEKKYSLKEG